MACVLIIDDDASIAVTFGAALMSAGHRVIVVSSALDGIRIMAGQPVDVTICDLRLPDMSGLELLRSVHPNGGTSRFVLISAFANTKDVVEAMRLGAYDFVDKPLTSDELLAIVAAAATSHRSAPAAIEAAEPIQELHAAARWARAVVPVADSPHDLRTIRDWGRWVAASAGTLRNWCHTAGLQPRRSLLFARLLRAIALSAACGVDPESLLESTDPRTIASMMRTAGLSGGCPRTIDQFIERQTLVQDADALREWRRAWQARLDALSS